MFGQTSASATGSPLPSAWHASEAGRQGQGRLWSDLTTLCALLHIHAPSSFKAEKMLFQHVQFKVGQRIHTLGQRFDMLYIVHAGCLKSVSIDHLGAEQVLDFPMKGDMLGLDGIHGGRYASEMVVLVDCDLILLPFKRLIALGRVHPELKELMYSVMSRKLAYDQRTIGQLGSCAAEVRVARFLIAQAERFAVRGVASMEFSLCMTRLEIGSYLGLSLETVSRILSALKDAGLINVAHRAIRINDAAGLKALRRLPSLHNNHGGGIPAPGLRGAPLASPMAQ